MADIISSEPIPSDPSSKSHSHSNTPELPNPREICKKCHQLILEGHAYELGEDRWHISCFTCSKCSTSLGCNSNFLVLGNGNLICSQCSYNCKQCGRKIDDLAILTGDQAYCSNCFKCRSCKQNIEDLRYARTSKGLFCMDCHEKLMAKKKKYDAKKKLIQAEKLRSSVQSTKSPAASTQDSHNNTLIQSYMSPSDLEQTHLISSSTSSTSLSSKNKDLPVPPSLTSNTHYQHMSPSPDRSSTTRATQNATSSLFDNVSPHAPILEDATSKVTPSSSGSSIYTPVPVPESRETLNEYDFSIEEVKDDDDSIDSDDESDKNRGRTLRKRGQSQSQSQLATPPITADKPDKLSQEVKSADQTSLPEPNITPQQQTHLKPPVPITPRIQQTGDALQQTQQQSLSQQQQQQQSSKNFLIRSPNQYHDNEFHNAKSPIVMGGLTSPIKPQAVTMEPGSNGVSHEVRPIISSPFAKANRQARVVESDDIITDGIDIDTSAIAMGTPPTTGGNFSHNGTPFLTSPPPKLPVPSTPDEASQEVRGLGLGVEGVDYELNRAMALATVTHSVTHLDQPPDQQQQQQLLQQQQLTRKTSLIRSLKHRRTSSNGSTSTPSSLNKFNFFKKDGVDSKTHSRKVSESSIHSLNGTAFSTPPLVNRNSFNGSFARADVIDEDKVPGFEFVNEPSNLGIAGIKAEISSLMSTKSELETGLITLKVERSQLEESLRKLSKQVTFEESKLNELHKQVAELQGTKARLTEENNQLREQNRHYKLTRSSSIETDSSSPLNKPTDLAESVTTLGESTTSNEDEQSHKATRLRFWRRQKNLVTTNAPVATIPESAQSSTSSVPSSFSAQGLRISQPVSNSVSGSKFHRSISTNILDSFLGDHQQSHDLFSSTIQARADYEGTKVPFIITKCISVVELRGLESEGIYRISGGNSTIVAIETAFANLAPGVTEDKKLEELMSGDINAVTSALKRYLRKLNDPIIPFGLYDEFIRVSTSNPRERRAQELKKVIYKLPRANRHTLWLLCNHLKLVSSMQNVNRMGFKNLAVVFAPTLARDSTGEREMTDMGARNDSTECLLTECEEVFAGYSG